MMGLIFLFVSLVAILVHSLFLKDKSLRNILEVIFLYLLFINLGIGSTIAGLSHIFNGPATAQLIGWASGSPFQYEVGVADLAMGILGLLSPFIRGNFWVAAVIVNSTFLLGCLVGHINDLVKSGNAAAYNIGPNIFIADLIMPILLICLIILYGKLNKS